MSHPVADLMKQRINSYNQSENIFDTFCNYWKYDVKLHVESNEERWCRWCMIAYRNGQRKLHECHECFLRISFMYDDDYVCNGCDDRYCYKCFMLRKRHGVENFCKGCDHIFTTVPEHGYCYECVNRYYIDDDY